MSTDFDAPDSTAPQHYPPIVPGHSTTLPVAEEGEPVELRTGDVIHTVDCNKGGELVLAFPLNGVILWDTTDETYSWVETRDLSKELANSPCSIHRDPFDIAGKARNLTVRLPPEFNVNGLTSYWCVADPNAGSHKVPVSLTHHYDEHGISDVSIDRLAIYNTWGELADQLAAQQQAWGGEKQPALLITTADSTGQS